MAVLWVHAEPNAESILVYFIMVRPFCLKDHLLSSTISIRQGDFVLLFDETCCRDAGILKRATASRPYELFDDPYVQISTVLA